MKKVNFMTLCLMLSIMSVHAQKLKEGSLAFLNGEKELNIVFDFTGALIDNKSEKDFVDIQGVRKGDEWKTKWENSTKKGFYILFLVKFNEHLIGKHELRGGSFPNATYQATIRINKIDSDGEVRGEAVFTQANSTELLARVKINGDGGRWGSLENLFGDGFEKAGDKFGKFVARKLK
jgi:hypothetical protein